MIDIDKVAAAMLYAVEQYVWADVEEAEHEHYRRLARAAVGAILPPLPRLTRVEVSMFGQLFKREHWADSWALSWQDDGRTLKLFGKGNGLEAQAERDAALIGEVNGDR